MLPLTLERGRWSPDSIPPVTPRPPFVILPTLRIGDGNLSIDVRLSSLSERVRWLPALPRLCPLPRSLPPISTESVNFPSSYGDFLPVFQTHHADMSRQFRAFYQRLSLFYFGNRCQRFLSWREPVRRLTWSFTTVSYIGNSSYHFSPAP